MVRADLVELIEPQTCFSTSVANLCGSYSSPTNVLCFFCSRTLCVRFCVWQMVRADLAELLEVPLDGAPYGYTPFCNDRPEMEGFQSVLFSAHGTWRKSTLSLMHAFTVLRNYIQCKTRLKFSHIFTLLCVCSWCYLSWDFLGSGSKKSHLGNRRYHISALYVVDLLRFRRLAAGDRLRGQYQALSQDPNSLANLDQDLPNNTIHQVPIKSLPQEWLWCETWCSEASKPAAKTIDLVSIPNVPSNVFACCLISLCMCWNL